MKYLPFMLASFPLLAGKTSKEMHLIYRETQSNSPDKCMHHSRSRSYPGPDNIFMEPIQLQHLPPAPPSSPKDLSLNEISIAIPDQTMQEQIQAITKEDKVGNGKCCTPTRLVVVGSICTAIAGVTTAVVTATVTLIVHFTTK